MAILTTSFSEVAYIDKPGGNLALVFIHGNSSCKEVFEQQFNTPLLSNYRHIALDLPGHGDSPPAADPKHYCVGDYARLLREFLDSLSIDNAVLIGWSLGGHVALEAAAQGLDCAGIVISGTPPFGPGVEGIEEAFHATENMALTSKVDFTDEEALLYAAATLGGETLVTPHLLAKVKSCDGRSRSNMLENWCQPGSGHPALPFVEQWSKPIAVIQGEQDAFVQLSYFNKPLWKNLWRSQIQVLADVGHAPFLQSPEIFNGMLADFLSEEIVQS